MARPTSVQLITEGERRFVSIHFTDKPAPEHFMDIEVLVKDGAVALTCPRYDCRIFMPVGAMPLIADAVKDLAA